MVRKCRVVSEIAVMEVDVRTTRPPPDHFDDVVPPSANKRTKTTSSAGTDFQLISSTTTTTSFVKLRTRRRRLLLPENSLPAPPPPETTTIRTSASDDICCCSEVVEESVVKFVDLEDEKDEHGVAYKSNRESRETTPSSQFQSTQSGDMESPAGKSEATSSNRSSSTVKIMPAESDLEEFFIAAEKNIQKRFTEKYNYDIVGDVPLEGRYEWVRLKP